MSGKAVITTWTALLFLSAGCARVHETNAPREPALSAPAKSVVPAKPRPARQPPHHAVQRPRPLPATSSPRPTGISLNRTTRAPGSRYSDLPSLINADSMWTTYGRSLIVTRGADEPVPLFRQAIVLAAVRDALADSPALPKAEFLKGMLTLTFGKGTSAEIARDINRAIAVPEVAKLAVWVGG